MIDRTITLLKFRNVLKSINLTKKIFIELDEHGLLKTLALNPNVKSSDLILLEDFWSVNNSRNNYISSDKIEDHKLKEYNNNILALIEQQLREMDWINIANSELKKVL